MLYHFSGLAGAGMNPLARLMRAWGHEVQGSDRAFDRGQHAALRAGLQGDGIRILPQDGSAVHAGIDRFVYSAAVEQDTPEQRFARAHGLACLARPALLAEVVNGGQPGVAVAGTSGKSTVSGMLAWILRRGGAPATVLGGAALAGEGVNGCFAAGPRGGVVVAEACESDGSLPGYRPAIGIIHNVTRDHGELDSLRGQFAAFAANCRLLLANARCPVAAGLASGHPSARTYGAVEAATCRLEVCDLAAGSARGLLHLPQGPLELVLSHPGLHNLENAAAAALAAGELGLAPEAIAEALASFPGVARRFEVVGVAEGGIRVVDDYAHNGDKIRAAVTAAQAGCERLLAIFQPHGYGPARFLRPELRELWPTLLRPQDRLCYAGIHFAGGSVVQDLSSQDLCDDLIGRIVAHHAPDHQAVLAWAVEQAIPGDTILLMGARDPELPRLARALVAML